MLSNLINSEVELLVIGIVYSTLSAVILPLYAVIIWVLRVNPDYRKNSSYQLINVMNLCHVAQCSCHFMTGLFLIFPEFREEVPVLVGITGSTGFNSFYADYIILAVLSLARMQLSYSTAKSATWQPWMIISLSLDLPYILISWLISCISQNFSISGSTWHYDRTVPLISVLSRVEPVICWSALPLSYFSQIMVLYSIFKKRSKMSRSGQMYRSEVAILIQATVLTVYMLIFQLSWALCSTIFEMTNIKYAIIYTGWIFFSHLNLILMIFTNRGIRREIRKIFKYKTSVSRASTTQF